MPHKNIITVMIYAADRFISSKRCVVEDVVLHCPSGAVSLAYTDEGLAGGGPVLVFVHGLGQQLTAWPSAIADALLRDGCRVIKCDNRDVGQSTRLHGNPNNTWLYLLSQFGCVGSAPYLLDDMADDLCNLIAHLNAGPVHLIGASMGGMVCQIVAARHPFMVRSLTSIMSSSGDHRLPGARPDVLRHITRPPARSTPDMAVAHGVRTWELIGSPRYPTARQVLERRVRDELQRGHPEGGGTERQFAAILASSSRVPLLRQISVPTLVIHGDADPLIPLAAGRHVYENTPGARLEVIEGMGHDFPDALSPTISALIARHVERAERVSSLVGAHS